MESGAYFLDGLRKLSGGTPRSGTWMGWVSRCAWRCARRMDERRAAALADRMFQLGLEGGLEVGGRIDRPRTRHRRLL